MTEKFTPSPWNVRWIGFGLNRFDVQINLKIGNNENECNANANLIAAAPELYQALAAVVDTHRGIDTFVIQNASKALAKARGE